MSITIWISIFFIIRCLLVFIYTRKAINIIYNSTNWKRLSEVYNPTGIMWPIRALAIYKWTFNQMFPGLKNE